MNSKSQDSEKNRKFISLLIPNQRRIHAYILYLVPSVSDVEDILQDTLTEMWNKFESFKDGTNFTAWGIAIARFKIMEFQRKYKKSKLFFSDTTNDLLVAECDEKIDSLNDEISTLKLCMKKLSDKHKFYLLMRYEQNLTFREIAKQVGITMQAVHKSFCRIHARLVQCVQSSIQPEDLA